MKRIFWMAPLGLALCVAPFAIGRAMAATREGGINADASIAAGATSSTRKGDNAEQNARVARATSDFDNTRADRRETAWGRFVADALRDKTRADIALVNAGTLENGVLEAGDVSQNDIADLLSFGDDEVATIQISGAQLRAALERAVAASPTASPAWLHLSGATATFNARAKSGARLTSLQANGRDVQADDSFSVAMPMGLAEGGSGYYKIWKGGGQGKIVSLLQTVVAYAHARREISPDNETRIRAN